MGQRKFVGFWAVDNYNTTYNCRHNYDYYSIWATLRTTTKNDYLNKIINFIRNET